jgi:segregation and condensation protein A
MSIDIHLPHFEGPLPLLLYLIRKEEMDIFDIDIYAITSQYMEYIRRMKELDLETAGDFVAMAATLIQIKSQMLLPQYNAEGELLEMEDPRKELVNRLLEYQNFQDISKRLYARPLMGRDIWGRGIREELPQDEEEGDIIIEDGGLFALISYYRRAIRNIKKTVHHVAIKTKSIAGQIMQIKDRLIVGQRVILRELITSVEDFRSELLITFLASLELGKMGFVNVFQSEVYGEIYLTAKKTIDEKAMEHVAEYNSIEAEKIAESLFEEEAPQEASLDLAETEETEQLELSANDQYAILAASDTDIEDAEKEMNLEELQSVEVVPVGEDPQQGDANV